MEIQDQINEIMDCFNFGKVARVMEQLNWTWASVERVPEEWEIRVEARRLIEGVLKESGVNTFLASGGLMARMQDGFLSLSFVLEEWDTFS